MLLPSRASIPAIHRSIVNKLHVYFELTTYTNLKRLAEQAPRRRNARQQGGDVAEDDRTGKLVGSAHSVAISGISWAAIGSGGTQGECLS